MKRVLKLLWQGIRGFGSGVWGFVVWGVWLALGILLAVQLYVVSANELAVPGFALRRLENHLAASGVRLTFNRTSFDPTGRILIEDVRAYLPEFAEPVLTARAIYCRLNPWTLVVGRFEPREIRVVDASASVPSMLSPSGRPEEIVRQLDVTILPGNRQVELPHLSARVAGVVVSGRGIVPIPELRETGRPGIVALITQQFPSVCRQALAVAEQLAAFEQPSLELEVTSSAGGAPVINVLLLARTARIQIPVAAEARDVRLVTRALLFEDAPTSQLEFAAAELRLPFETTAQRVQALVVGGVRRGGGFRFEPRQFDVTADSITSGGFSAGAISAEILPRPLPRLDAKVVAQIAGAPLALQAQADFNARTADLSFRGAVSPRLLTPLGARLGVDVRRFFDFEGLDCEEGSVRLGPGWKFERLDARVNVHQALAYGVRLDEGRASVTFDRQRFSAPDAYARIGDNFARGSYEQDLTSKAFRFLLNGQLRPLDISGWFRPWWPNFFRQFEFPGAPPVASVDVGGVWRDGLRTAVFILADATKPTVRGASFDHLRTRLFVRPGFYDGLELVATSGQGAVEGTFTYNLDLDSRELQQFDLNLRTTIGVDLASQILGPASARFFAPYQLEAPPVVALQARFAGPAARGGTHQAIDATIKTKGELRFYHFPVRDASFGLAIRDDEITVSDIDAFVAGGRASGRTRIWGAATDRRVGFDIAVKDASLGESVVTVQEFFARRRGQTPPTPGKFVQEKANVRIELDASAEGPYTDPLGYKGSGSVVLRGAEIGAVPLLGTLSELVKFTTLRFTEARGTFKIEGPKLAFSTFTLRGANSAIDAHGVYALDAHELDFNAKIFPFQESDNLVKTVVGAVLAPLSNVMEVKLTGSLEKPAWGFALLSSSTPAGTGVNEKPEARPAETGPGTSTSAENKSISDAKL